MLDKRGKMSLVWLPPGAFPLPIFDVVLNAKTVRGSMASTSRITSPSRGCCGRR
jgi:propanol-preferring alcohol dehydrogenase